jgi:hypothetical protein
VTAVELDSASVLLDSSVVVVGEDVVVVALVVVDGAGGGATGGSGGVAGGVVVAELVGAGGGVWGVTVDGAVVVDGLVTVGVGVVLLPSVCPQAAASKLSTVAQPNSERCNKKERGDVNFMGMSPLEQ